MHISDSSCSLQNSHDDLFIYSVLIYSVAAIINEDTHILAFGLGATESNHVDNDIFIHSRQDEQAKETFLFGLFRACLHPETTWHSG